LFNCPKVHCDRAQVFIIKYFVRELMADYYTILPWTKLLAECRISKQSYVASWSCCLDIVKKSGQSLYSIVFRLHIIETVTLLVTGVVLHRRYIIFQPLISTTIHIRKEFAVSSIENVKARLQRNRLRNINSMLFPP
jgi:hypothetical protein